MNEIRLNVFNQNDGFHALEMEYMPATRFGEIRRDCGKRLKKSLVTAAKIAGYTTLQLSLDIATIMAFMELNTDWSTRNPTLLSASKVCHRYIARPTMDIREFMLQYTPEITLGGQHLSEVFIAALVEECVCRGLIQRAILPAVSKILPKKCGEFVNEQMTRIAVSAMLFSLAHQSNMYSSMGIWPQLTGGLFYGAMAERENSLFIPTMTHFFSNLILGAGEN